MILSRDTHIRVERLIRYGLASLCALQVSLILAEETCFSSPSSVLSSRKQVTSIFTADVDGDGDQDIIEGSLATSPTFVPTITWYETGVGHSPHLVAEVGLRLIIVSAADLDGDGEVSTSDLEELLADWG